MSRSIARLTPFVALTLAAGCVASAPPAPRPESGAAIVSAAVVDAAAAQIDRVTLTISGEFLTTTVVQPLAKVDETHYGGIVAELPAGGGYLFVAEAVGAGPQAPVLLRGHQGNVAIPSGHAAEVALQLHAVPTSSVPAIDALSASTTTVTFGEQVSVSVEAHSPDGHPLTYAWEASCGTLSASSQPAARWTAPLLEGTCELSARVTDPLNATSVGGALSIRVDAPCLAGQGCTPAQPCATAGVTACSAPTGPATCGPTAWAPDGTACTGADGAGTCAQGACVTPARFPEAMVTLSFDDGRTSQLLALPLLERHGFHATFFVITGWVGGAGYLTLSDLRSVASAGHEVASHSVHHAHLTTLSDAALRAELADSQAWLQANVSAGAGQTFACPYGEYDARVVAVSRELYRAHRTGEWRFNLADADPALLGELVATDPVAALEAYVEQAIAERSWLILGFHNLTTGTPPDAYWYGVDDLAAFLAYLASRPVRVVTVAEGAASLVAPAPVPP